MIMTARVAPLVCFLVFVGGIGGAASAHSGDHDGRRVSAGAVPLPKVEPRLPGPVSMPEVEPAEPGPVPMPNIGSHEQFPVPVPLPELEPRRR